MVRLAAVACAVLALAGCATEYGDMGFAGGVAANRIDENTAIISGRGNGYTDADTISRFVLRKAAESTLLWGYDYFVIVGAQDRTSHGSIATGGYAQTTGTVTGYGNVATVSTTTSYSPPTYIPITKPGENMTIKMFKGAKPADMMTAYDARSVLRFMGVATTN